MKKKGFTLIELLAVIVILAVIMVIAVPKILDVIENSRKSAAKSSAELYIDAIEKNNTIASIDKNVSKINDGTYDVTKLNVNVKGEKPTKGEVIIENGKVKNADMCVNGFQIIYSKRIINSVTKNDGCKKDSDSNYNGFVTDGLIQNLILNKNTELVAAIGEPTYNDDYIKLEGNTVLATEENLKLESPFTLALRFRNLKFSSSESKEYSLLIGNGTTGSNIGTRTVGVLFHKNLGTLTVHAGAGDNNTISLDSSLLFNNNEIWKTLIMRYDGENLSLWLDGTKLGELKVTFYPKDTKLFIGGYGTSGTSSSGIYWGFMNGDYSNCAIYNRGLTDDEIINFGF